MQKNMVSLSIVLLLMGCVGKSTTTGLQDNIYRDTYVTTISSQNHSLGKFSFYIPQSKNEYEFEHLRIIEETNEVGTMVTIGPAAYDKSFFMAIVEARPSVPMDLYMEIVTKKTLAKTLKEPIKLLYQEKTTIKKQPAVYQVYKMTSYIEIEKDVVKELDLTLGIYYIFYQDYIVTLSSAAINYGENKITDPKIMIENKWDPQKEFVNSFELYVK